MAWFHDHQRSLPWRESRDPYPVLVSEVMLQQTQVRRVIPKFQMFMEEWPTVETLSASTTAKLLLVWSGLGYNSRALRLREAARLIAQSGWPHTLAELGKLPGVGPYTAAAIGSISFGITAPAIDTNLTRVLSRWAGESISGRNLSTYARHVLCEPAGEWNQAVMDLGAGLCTPRAPRCNLCPVQEWCEEPSIYEPPPRQSRFEGSHRQLRGALVRAHINGADLLDVGLALNRSDSEIASAIEALTLEGLLVSES